MTQDYIIPTSKYEMIAQYLWEESEDNYLICQALQGKRDAIITVLADKIDAPNAVLVATKRNPQFVEGGMQINIIAQSNSKAEKLLEFLEKKPAMFVSAGKDLSVAISKWYNLSEDSGHYYYCIGKGELRKKVSFPVVELTAEHESIVCNSPNLRKPIEPDNLLEIYKKSMGSDSSAVFAVIQDDKIISYCHIGGGVIWDIFTRDDKRKMGFGQSVLSVAAEWSLELDEKIIYSMIKSNIASKALCESVGFKFWFEMFRYRTYPK